MRLAVSLSTVVSSGSGFIASASGYRLVTTHAFVADSPLPRLSDAVLGVKAGFVREVPVMDDRVRAAQVGPANPFHTLSFDLSLLRADWTPS